MNRSASIRLTASPCSLPSSSIPRRAKRSGTLLREAREQELNRRDVHTVAGARFLLPKGSSFHVDHDHGAGEPILWVADLVAGAVRAHRIGDPTTRDALDNCVHENQGSISLRPHS